MRTISTADNLLFTSPGGRATYARCDVKDGSSGQWRDLTSWPGVNLVLAVSFSDSMDSEGQSAQVSLKRETEQLSLAPLMHGSPLNLGFGFPGTYYPLLSVGAPFRIYTADVPTDAAPAAADWRLMLEGRIDSVEAASDEDIVLEVSDGQGELRDLFIEKERIYAYAQGGSATRGLLLWTPLMASDAGDLVIPTDANRNGHFFVAENDGASSTASPEPTWPSGGGATVADNTQIWDETGTTSTIAGTPLETVLQQLITDNGGTPTLSVPVSPAWDIRWYLQQRQPLWDALRALVDQIGWDLRFKYNSGSFLLTLWTPDRTKTTPDRTFSASETWHVTQMKIDIAKIRNAVQSVFSASGSADPAGNPLRVPVLEEDAASIAKYGRRFMEMGEASTSNVDTTAEAQAMALAALADLKEPSVEKRVEMPYFPFVELGDLYRFSPDAVHHDQNLDLAVVGYEHHINADGDAVTVLMCRGKPSTGTDRWLARSAELNADDIHRLGLSDSHSVTLAASSVVGGTLLTANGDYNKKALGQDFEWHVDTGSSFTPSNATLVQGQGGNQVTVPNLIAGKTYYARAVPVRRNYSRIARGQPSAAMSFVAGRASAGHIHDGIALGDYPLNGGFETRLDTASMPDHWSVYAGVLATDVDVMEDGNGFSGNRYIRLKTKNGGIRSAIFPILNEAMESSRRGGMYRLSWWRKAGTSNSAGATYDTLVRLLDYAGAEVDILTVAAALPCDDRKTHWVLEHVFVQLRAGDSSARSAQLEIIGRAGATFQLDVDEYRVQFLGSPWFEVGDTSEFTDAYEAIPGFDNTYAAFGTGTDSIPAFRRNQFGRVFLKGAYKHATTTNVNLSLVTLPASFAPLKKASFPVTANGQHGLVEISTAGVVKLVSADNANPSTKIVLDGISYETFETA